MSEPNLEEQIDDLRKEIVILRDQNRSLNRRLSKEEGPLQSKIARLEHDLKWYEEKSKRLKAGMQHAYSELTEIYKLICRARGDQNKHIHSVAESKLWEQGHSAAGGIFANVQAHGFNKNYSERIVDAVHLELFGEDEAFLAEH